MGTLSEHVRGSLLHGKNSAKGETKIYIDSADGADPSCGYSEGGTPISGETLNEEKGEFLGEQKLVVATVV